MRTRGETSRSTLPAAYPCHGSRQNRPTMDNARGALVSLAQGFRLRGIETRWVAVSYREQMGEGTGSRARIGPLSGKGRPVETALSPKTGPKRVWRGLLELSTMSHGSTSRCIPLACCHALLLCKRRVDRSGIHPLVWRPEIFELTHHVCRSNRAEGAKPQRETETEDGSVRHHYGADGEKQRARF